MNRPRRTDTIRAVAGQPMRPVLPDTDLVGVRTPQWKYIRAGREEELYDLQADPAERRNVAAAQADVVEQLRARLQRWLTAHPLRPADPGLINEHLRESLRTLGYLQ